MLHEKGAKVSYNVPYISQIQLPHGTLLSIELTPEYLSSADCVVIATDHSCYNVEQIVSWAKLVYDTRGATKGLKQSNIVRLGE
ncbi:UDP binding domain-containing protein [Chloroflexota bacterium]